MKVLVGLIVLVNIHTIYGKILPDDLAKLMCRRSDPNISGCLLNNMDKILSFLANGIPSAKIGPIEPFHIDLMEADGDFENLKIKVAVKNITVYGASTNKFTKIHVDPKSQTGEVTILAPHVRMTCEYHASGRLFVIPLESSAYFEGEFNNTKLSANFRFKEVKMKGIKYLSANITTDTMHIDTGNIKLTSIDPAQQPLVNVIQNFFNENNRLVLDTINPFAVYYGPEFAKNVINSFLRRIPSNELLPL